MPLFRSSRTQEIHYPIEEDLYGEAKEEDIWGCINEEMDQGHQDYIERWFQMSSTERHHSFLLQNLLLSYHLHLLIFHAHVQFQVYMLNLRMNASLYLFHTWIHWKYSYT